MAGHLTATEAARELEISISTLYAYVSRGLVRSETAGGKTRERRYNAEDVQQLKTRKEQRRHPHKAVEGALHWGSPVLESAITDIREGRVMYRGHDAVALACDYSAEEVAHLLWTGELRKRSPEAPIELSTATDGHGWNERIEAVLGEVADLQPVERFQVVLPLVAREDLAAHDLRRAQTVRTGENILRVMARLAGGSRGPAPVGLSLAGHLQHHWAPRKRAAIALFDQALVLCADHELNTSTFTARCVASTGASPYGVVLAGLSALQGVRHGGATERVMDFMRAVEAGGKAGTVIAAYLRRGESVPGFGHPLYPDGDPRGAALLAAIYEACPSAAGARLAREVEGAMGQLMGARPNIDFALVTLARSLSLPAGAPLGLFALGRTMGWIAHAIEQYASEEMIRPRARYVGASIEK